MNDLERLRAEQDARRQAARTGYATPYGRAVNRYLNVAAYRDSHPVPVTSERCSRQPEVPGPVTVGVDDTPAGYTAVDHAAIEAELRGGGLQLVHVQDPAAGRDPAQARGTELLERMVERVHAYSPAVAVTGRLMVGAPVDVLLDAIRAGDLIVVGHRHGVVNTAFGLATGERIASRHRGPVLVVRMPGWPPGAEFATRPIVVGVDDSGASALAMSFALNEARLRGCEVIVLHATRRPSGSPGRTEERDGVVVHHRVVTVDPVSALTAASGRAAAVVIGRRGRANPTRAVLGSVGRSMVQHADCPVFLVG